MVLLCNLPQKSLDLIFDYGWYGDGKTFLKKREKKKKKKNGPKLGFLLSQKSRIFFTNFSFYLFYFGPTKVPVIGSCP